MVSHPYRFFRISSLFFALWLALMGIACISPPPDLAHAELGATSENPLHITKDGKRHMLRGFRAGPYMGDLEQIAHAFLSEHGTAIGLDLQKVNFDFDRSTRWRERDVVRLQQTYQNVPVFGAQAILLIEESSTVVMMSHTSQEGINADIVPSLLENQAITVAYGAIHGSPSKLHSCDLMLLPGGDGGQLVWAVDVSTTEPLGSWLAFVDAHDGRILSLTNMLRSAEGRVYEHNPANSDLITAELSDLLGDQTELTGTFANVQSRVFVDGTPTLERLATADADGNFLYDPDKTGATDPFVEVNAYYHVTSIASYFANTHGYSAPGPLTVLTNYRDSENEPLENAFFSPRDRELILGQGAVADWGYDSDFIAHEFGHSVNHELIEIFYNPLIFYDQYVRQVGPASVDEGLADYWSCSFHDDPMLGEYLHSLYLPGSRDLENTLVCPDDIQGDGHADGQFVSGAAWEIRSLVGVEIADSLIYGTLSLLTFSPTFREFAEAVMAIASVFETDGEISSTDVEAIRGILEGRGLFRCDHSLPLEDGEPLEIRVLNVPGLLSVPDEICSTAREFGLTFGSFFQLALELPDESAGTIESVELSIAMERLDGLEFGEDDLEYTFYARKDEMITFSTNQIPMTGVGFHPVPVASEFDALFEGSPSTLELLADDPNLPIESGASYYFSLIHSNCPSVLMTVTPTIHFADSGDAGPDGGQSSPHDEGGCNCSLSSLSSSNALSLATRLLIL